MNTTTAGSDTGNYRTRDFDVVQCYSDQIKRPNMAIPMAKRHIHCHAELSRKWRHDTLVKNRSKANDWNKESKTPFFYESV